MDREKTGGLIASARKERGLTQKELAAMLHVSDRAVSKWERGAGFPDVSLTVTAAVYTADGAPAGETTVTIDGTRKVVGEKSFFGRFAIACVEPTCREEAMAHIRWDAMEVEGWQDIFYSRAGESLSLGVERMLYITENMQSFGLKLEDGRIIATDPEYVPLLASEYYYSIRPVFGMHL